MNIYFAGAIAGGGSFEKEQQQIVQICEQLGHTVISKQHAYQSGRESIDPQTIFQRDLWWLMRKSDAVVAELSVPSYGVGFEIGTASFMGLPILGLTSNRTSAFVEGNIFPNFDSHKYEKGTLPGIIEEWDKNLDIFAKRRQGIYIAFEGLNQCGKGTQMNLLVNRLKNENFPVWRGREPGTNWLGEEIRKLVQVQTDEVPLPRAEVALYMTQRAQNVEKEIKPRLIDGQAVIMDRSDGTSLAFQGFGRQQDALRIAVLNGYAVDNVHPDVVIYLDIPDAEIKNRGSVTQTEYDRHEHEADDFHQRCRQGYEKVLQLDKLSPPKTWFRINAMGDPQQVHERIWDTISPILQIKFSTDNNPPIEQKVEKR